MIVARTYARRTRPRMKRAEAATAVEIVRRGHCVYQGPRCDCKFGVVQLGTTQGHEHGSGCCELREIAIVLAGLNEKQYQEAYDRGFGRVRRVVRAVDKIARDRRRPENVLADEIDFSVRAANTIQMALGSGATVAQLAVLSAEEWLARRNSGARVVREIREALARFGLKLRGDS